MDFETVTEARKRGGGDIPGRGPQIGKPTILIPGSPEENNT